MMHQSNPGVRRRRDSQPSIHLPRSVYLPSMKTGADGFSRFSLGAKNSSLAKSTAPPRRSDVRSISSVKSIRTKSVRHKKAQRLTGHRVTETQRETAERMSSRYRSVSL